MRGVTFKVGMKVRMHGTGQQYRVEVIVPNADGTPSVIYGRQLNADGSIRKDAKKTTLHPNQLVPA